MKKLKIYSLSQVKNHFLGLEQVNYLKEYSKKKSKIFFKKSTYPEIGELRILYKALRNFSPELIIAIGGDL